MLQVCPYLFTELSSSPWLPKDRHSSIPFKIANSRAPNQPLQPAALLSSRFGCPGSKQFMVYWTCRVWIHTQCLCIDWLLPEWTSVYSLALNTLGLQLMLKCLVFFDVISDSHRLLPIFCASSPQHWYRYLSWCYPTVFLLLIHGKTMSHSPFYFPQLAYAESETGPLRSLSEEQMEMQTLEQAWLGCRLAPPPAS